MPERLAVSDEVRRETELRLQDIGRRRAALAAASEELHRDASIALKAAKGVVPMRRAAELTGLNRSTIYELYLP